MFSQSDIVHRSGISIQVGNKTYAYSLKYFMKYFVAYSNKKAQSVSKINKNLNQTVQLNSVAALFQASQSIIAGNKPASACTFQDSSEFFTFLINGREILCPHETNCYVFDNALLVQQKNFFPTRDITYLQMARFIADRVNNFAPPKEKFNIDSTIADSVIDILQGTNMGDEHIEVLSVMIATLFIAEPKRNPSCFIPTLMILDLIKNKCPTPFGDVYMWDNCLQHDVLVNQHGESQSTHQIYIYPMLVGIPDFFDLQNDNKVTLCDSEKKFLNADKKFNQHKNQKIINASEYLVQLGGYFPLSHRFSYSELEGKRAEDIATLSDQKSFIAISDWLIFHKIAKNIHMNQLYISHHPNLDSQKAILTEIIFPEIWEKAFQFAKPDFNTVRHTSFAYPQLLTMFGCKQNKVTPEKVANTLFLVQDSSKYGQDKANELRRQFQFWSVQNECDFGIEEVDKVIKRTYKM